jgi:hypothetical protein
MVLGTLIISQARMRWIIGVRLVNIKGYNGYSLISPREGVLQQHKLQRLDVQVFEVR